MAEVSRDGGDVPVVPKMRGAEAVGAEGRGSDGEQLSVNEIRGVVVEKVDLLVAYPLMREPLRAPEKPRLSVHESFDGLTALARCIGRL